MPSGVSLQSKVELSGNLFTHDPGKTLYQNIGTMLDGLADEMEGIVRADIVSRKGSMPYSIGWTERHVMGYRVGRTGKHWAVWAAVGLPTTGMDKATAIRTKAAAAGIEARWHPFRLVKSAVYRAKALLSANLARNLE